jgi:hypothetical protein
MTKQSKAMVVIGCMVGVILIAGLAYLIKPRDPACAKLEAKRNLALEFCKGLAVKAATERCEGLADDPQTLGACMNVVVPVAESSCWGYINLQGMKRELDALCP